MTIRELIIELQKQPNQDLRVVVRGYESGVNDVDELQQCYLELDANTEWYYGQHSDLHQSNNSHNIEAIELIGYNKIAKRKS